MNLEGVLKHQITPKDPTETDRIGFGSHFAINIRIIFNSQFFSHPFYSVLINLMQLILTSSKPEGGFFKSSIFLLLTFCKTVDNSMKITNLVAPSSDKD